MTQEPVQSVLTQFVMRQAQGVPRLLTPTWEEKTPGPYQMYNNGGVEIDVAEFLYGLIRMIKPRRCLETGTHKGISAAYIAQALRENGFTGGGRADEGFLETLEIEDVHRDDAIALWHRMGLHPGKVACILTRSLEYTPSNTLDFVLLDSEPQVRFAEFERFWSHMEPGCVIIIHDLHPSLGHSDVINPDHPNEPDWPYGDVRKTFLGRMIREHEVSVMSFPTPRGITMLQKTHSSFLHTRIAKGQE